MYGSLYIIVLCLPQIQGLSDDLNSDATQICGIKIERPMNVASERFGLEKLAARSGESILEVGFGTGHGLDAVAAAVSST